MKMFPRVITMFVTALMIVAIMMHAATAHFFRKGRLREVVRVSKRFFLMMQILLNKLQTHAQPNIVYY